MFHPILGVKYQPLKKVFMKMFFLADGLLLPFLVLAKIKSSNSVKGSTANKWHIQRKVTGIKRIHLEKGLFLRSMPGCSGLHGKSHS